MSNPAEQNLTEEEIRDLLPGYVFGILEPDELLLVDEYLAQHPEMQEEVAVLERTGSRLAYLAPPMNPPEGMKESIVSRIDLDLAAASLQSTAGTTGSADAKGPSEQRVTPDIPRGTPRGIPRTASQPTPPRGSIRTLPSPGFLEKIGEWWRTAFAWKIYALTATAAIALLAVIFSQAQENRRQDSALMATLEETVELLQNQNQDLLAEAAQLQTENEGLNIEISQLSVISSELETENSQLQQIMAQLQDNTRNQEMILASLPSIQQLVPLDGDDYGSDGSGYLVASTEGDFLVLTGLDPLPAELTYQLWLIENGQETPVSSGLVTVSSRETVLIPIELSIGANQFSTVGFSIEPAGGSQSPTQVVLHS